MTPGAARRPIHIAMSLQLHVGRGVRKGSKPVRLFVSNQNISKRVLLPPHATCTATSTCAATSRVANPTCVTRSPPSYQGATLPPWIATR